MTRQYLDHSREILTSPLSEYKHNQRTGMGHISLFGYQNRHDLREGFPLLTTKKTNFDFIAHELVLFLHGDTNIKYLVDNGVPIWNDNAFDYNLREMVDESIFPESTLEKRSRDWYSAKEEYVQRIKEDEEFAERWGELGPVYGSQWVHWPFFKQTGKKDSEGQELYVRDPEGINQIDRTIEKLVKNPTAKSNLVSAWNPQEVPNMALPPCHTMFQVNSNGEDLDLQLYQRSCDMFLGVPFNIASYALMTQIIADQAGLNPRHFVHTFGDVHFYCADGERAKWYRDNLDKLKFEIKDAPWRWGGSIKDVVDWINKEAPLEVEKDGTERKGKDRQDHVTAILTQMQREPRELPRVKISNKPYRELERNDFELIGYDPHKGILRSMAV
ncbi:MAG: thymidylate synthase [Candidatus Pacearchaeota archaeon]